MAGSKRPKRSSRTPKPLDRMGKPLIPPPGEEGRPALVVMIGKMGKPKPKQKR